MPFDAGTPLRVEETADGGWRLLEGLRYVGKYEPFLVPAGFETDFASVPRLLTWLVPTAGLYTRAAVLHDYLCRKEGFPRNDADGIFRRVLGESGVPTVRRYVMWAAVRVGGSLRGATFLDVLGIVLLVLLIIPVALPGTVYILAVLVLLFVVELLVWLALKVAGAVPRAGPVRFWWN